MSSASSTNARLWWNPSGCSRQTLNSMTTRGACPGSWRGRRRAGEVAVHHLSLVRREGPLAQSDVHGVDGARRAQQHFPGRARLRERASHEIELVLQRCQREARLRPAQAPEPVRVVEPTVLVASTHVGRILPRPVGQVVRHLDAELAARRARRPVRTADVSTRLRTPIASTDRPLDGAGTMGRPCHPSHGRASRGCPTGPRGSRNWRREGVRPCPPTCSASTPSLQ